MKDLILSQDYHTLLVDIKNQIKLSQQKDFNVVNQEIILIINTKQVELTWKKSYRYFTSKFKT